MSIAVAHHVSPTAEPALRLGAREAALRGTALEVIHVVENLDADSEEAYRAGISDAVEKVLTELEVPTLDWHLHVVAGGTGISDVSSAILSQVHAVGAEVLVVGARRRSPVGKAFLGSVTQTLVLEADVPVFVTKSPAQGT